MLVPRTTCQRAARNRARAEAAATPAEAPERVVIRDYRSGDTPGTCCNDHFVDRCRPAVTALERLIGGPASVVTLGLGHFARVPPIYRPSSVATPVIRTGRAGVRRRAAPRRPGRCCSILSPPGPMPPGSRPRDAGAA